MIVRILTEGQFDVDESHLEHIEELDQAMFEAIENGDEDAFGAALEAVLTAVRSEGKPVDPAEIVPSDLVVPHAGATLEEIRELLSGDGGLDDGDEESGASAEDAERV